MNAAGQALVEYLILTAIFVLLIAGIGRAIPLTFSQSTPFLGGKIEQRIQTGVGFANSKRTWNKPVNGEAKGGMRDP